MCQCEAVDEICRQKVKERDQKRYAKVVRILKAWGVDNPEVDILQPGTDTTWPILGFCGVKITDVENEIKLLVSYKEAHGDECWSNSSKRVTCLLELNACIKKNVEANQPYTKKRFFGLGKEVTLERTQYEYDYGGW